MNRKTNTDEQLQAAKATLNAAIRVIDNVLDGETLSESIRKEQFNPRTFYSFLKDVHKLSIASVEKPKPYEMNCSLDKVLETPIEKLYREIFGTPYEERGIYQIPDDAMETYRYVTQELLERERFILDHYFFEEDSIEAIGKALSVTGNRVRQIKSRAISKLRHPRRSIVLSSGLARYKEMQDETALRLKKEADLVERIFENQTKLILEDDDSLCYLVLAQPMDVLNLSVRAFNALYRAGYKTLTDIAKTPWDKLQLVRNVGSETTKEIKRKWEVYLKGKGLSEEMVIKIKTNWERMTESEDKCY